MSYPPPLHNGDGEVSAWIRTGDTEAALVYPNGIRVHYLARGESTGGLFGLYRWEFSEAVSGPGPHYHRTISESFYVLDGEVRIYDGERGVAAHTGDFVHVPPGGLHGFRNESGAPASMLLHFAPGAPREPYFEGLARLASGEEWSKDEFAAFMLAHDNIWVEE